MSVPKLSEPKPESFTIVEGKLAVTDIVVFVRDGKVVGRVDAVYDVSGLSDDLLRHLPVQRVRYGLPGQDEIRDKELRARVLEQRLATWESLPWWRRLFRAKPNFWDDLDLDLEHGSLP